jgi:hypothetical protein
MLWPGAVEPKFVTISSKSARGHFRSCITQLAHPCVVAPNELAYIRQPVHENAERLAGERSIGYKVLIFRESFGLGSLRDVVYRCSAPLNGRADKYQGSMGTPLSAARIGLYSRQIVEGMRYLEQVGFGVVGVHCGNVMMKTINEVAITDFENSVLGLQPFGMTAVRTARLRTLGRCTLYSLDFVHARFWGFC